MKKRTRWKEKEEGENRDKEGRRGVKEEEEYREDEED